MTGCNIFTVASSNFFISLDPMTIDARTQHAIL